MYISDVFSSHPTPLPSLSTFTTGILFSFNSLTHTLSLTQTHRFLDGKPVSIPRGQSSTSHTYQCEQVPLSPSDDSGFKDSPITHSVSPAQDVPPPIRLDKHPSFRKQRSAPCHIHIQRGCRCSPSPSGSYGAPSQSYGNGVGSFNEEMFGEQRIVSWQSVSPPDEGHAEENEELGSGQLRMDPGVAAGGEHHQYETMRHPSMKGQQQEEYIKMMPAFANRMTIQRPAVPSNYDVPPPFRNYETIQRPAVPNTESPILSLEALKPRGQVYENVSTAHLKEGEFVHYRPNYGFDEPFRTRTRNMEKRQFTRPRKNPHAQRQSPSRVSPPIPPRVPAMGPPTTDL